MHTVLEDIKSSLVALNPEEQNCNKSKKFEQDLLCINDELSYDEIGSSKFYFENDYKEGTDFFKNIYIDEFKHLGKKSVDLLTLSKFNDEDKGRFYFIEVKSGVNSKVLKSVKDKLIDTIEKLDTITFTNKNFISNIFVIGNEAEKELSFTAKIKKQIEDIEFLDMPLGKIRIYKSDSTINKNIR